MPAAAPRHGQPRGQLRGTAAKPPRPPPMRSASAGHGWLGWRDGAREDFCSAVSFCPGWVSAPGSEMPEGRSAPRLEPLKG